MVELGVLPNVHGCQLQTESGHRANGPIQPARRHQLAPVGQQRVPHGDEVSQQLVGAEIVPAPNVSMRRVADSGLGVEELLANADRLQPVRLLGVQPKVPILDLGQGGEVGFERSQQRRGDLDQSGRHGQVLAELVDDLDGITDGMVVLEADDVEGDLGSHIRVAVTVAADPGAERQRPGDRRQVDPETPQRPVELIEHVGNGAPVELVEVVDGVAGLVDGLGPGDAEIVGQPAAGR